MMNSYIERKLKDKLKAMAAVFPVISLTGPRQSGKTTLSRATFPEYSYLNLENMNEYSMIKNDPLRVLRSYGAKGVIIDEAQKMPELFSAIQVIVDETGDMGQFILTGSQNFLLLEKVSQSLAGRVGIVHLLPFGLSELTGADLPVDDLDEMMHKGTYPVIYDRNMAPGDFYPSYIQTYIERDVRSMKNIGDLNMFQRFVKLCAGRTGQLLNLSGLGNELGLNYKTVGSWISILEASFIVFLLRPHEKSFNKRLVKQPKLYFYDTGLLCSLLDITTKDQLGTHYMRGHIFESFVLSEYVKSRFHGGLRSDAFFFRNNAGNEVDLILEHGADLAAVEIKSSSTLSDDFFKGLDYYRKLSGIKPERLLLVYGGDRDYDLGRGRVLGWRSIETLNTAFD